MIKRNLIIPVLIIFSLLPVNAQVKKQEAGLKREVTLYNPYKPSLPESKKRSFLPDMNDTSKVRPDFHYDVKTSPFLPEYTISPIKAAALLPDPLPKLYKSYINFGIGNYLTPLAEISITNERSKKGSLGFYARHFSTNGNVELDNGKKAFAGYMDNDASLFGRKFFRKNTLEGSLDYSEKTRHAYGYDPVFSDYYPSNKEIRLPYTNLGAKASLSSLTLDSTDFSYDFRGSFNYFTSEKNMYQRKVAVSGMMAKSYNEFYIGSGVNYDSYHFSDFLQTPSEYVASISPFLKKSSEEWSFKLGIQALLEKDMAAFTVLHVYPDINFNFKVVPTYINFFAGLSGKLEKNEPMKVISENPFLIQNGSLYKLPSTSHDLVISTGLRGNTGLGGNYKVSASYSLISNMLFYSNIVIPDYLYPKRGNYFSALTDDVELLNVHAEMNGPINDNLSFNGEANLYDYTMSKFQYAWDKPGWDGKLGLKYNLRDKIIAGMEISVQGKRREIVNGDYVVPAPNPSIPAIKDPRVIMVMPDHFNLNLSAEYRYSKILSFWTKLNNISYRRYYEWAYYPTQGFLFMVGFTYSL
jgi:hypothetical protein